ncbi:MAG: hypothetical protein ACFFES_17730 [Candidatus Thorarchaeota archaeon]
MADRASKQLTIICICFGGIIVLLSVVYIVGSLVRGLSPTEYGDYILEVFGTGVIMLLIGLILICYDKRD